MKALIERGVKQNGQRQSGTGPMWMWQEGVKSAGSLQVLPDSKAAIDQECTSMPTQVHTHTQLKHTVTATWQNPVGMWMSCILHTCTYSISFCEHGSEWTMHKRYSVFITGVNKCVSTLYVNLTLQHDYNADPSINIGVNRNSEILSNKSVNFSVCDF